jgi:hypothetical protein
MPISARVAVSPTKESVLGAGASSANHANAPPAAVVNRQVIAKKAPPPVSPLEQRFFNGPAKGTIIYMYMGNWPQP